ncbi:MAG: hypothetical protein DU480_09865 [Nitrosomonas sp.]|uniref:AbiJ-NTD4 domain-containing protein n=1 Tax=Nitrosomonas sp. TaxID=42353 RepID=UPI0032EC4F1B
MNNRFSKRHGFHHFLETEILVRQDAPSDLRWYIVQLALECGFTAKDLRLLVCRLLKKRPNDDNWSDLNVMKEVEELIDSCNWYHTYDIIEGLTARMREASYLYERDKFESELNDFFIENGIGWKLSDGIVQMRGSEEFEEIVDVAEYQLETQNLSTARNELREARHDLSRRPSADITGAIQHSMAALECVAREACGDNKANLGDIMKRYRDIVPCPLDEAISKAWGYASENARHIREGREPAFEEAELVVGIVSVLSTYLVKKHEV